MQSPCTRIVASRGRRDRRQLASGTSEAALPAHACSCARRSGLIVGSASVVSAASVRNPLSASTIPGRVPAVCRMACTIGTSCPMSTALLTTVAATMKPAGFENSQDIITSAYLMDPTDAQWKDDPNMKEWVAFMDKWNPGGDKTDASNIYAYNVVRTMVQVLKQCGDELTRANIMKQAANLKDFEPGTLLPGIKVTTSPTDFYPIEQERLQRFKGETWELFGPVLSGDVAG